MKNVNVICVVGPIGSGKSSIIDKAYPAEESVRFLPGRIIRDAAGIGFMLRDEHPNAPATVEHLVLSLFRGMIELAAKLDRPLVCDGFPRTTAQAMALRDVCELMDFNVTVAVVESRPPESLHRKMLIGRAAKHAGEEKFDLARMAASMESSQKVIEFFQNVVDNPRFKCEVVRWDYQADAISHDTDEE